MLMIPVRPDRQGQGRGGASIRHVDDTLRASGHRLLLVEPSKTPDVKLTQTCYLQCGYEEAARVRDYYEAGADTVPFRKDLDAG